MVDGKTGTQMVKVAFLVFIFYLYCINIQKLQLGLGLDCYCPCVHYSVLFNPLQDFQYTYI